MKQPTLVSLRRKNTHRLIPSRFSEAGDSVLTRLAEDDAHLNDLFDLDHATNDRVLAENNRFADIGTEELVFGIPYYRTVNAAFVHSHPLGSRFNGPLRSAWYAAFELRTSQAEVAWHKSVELSEIDCFEESITYDDHLADFSAEFHDIRQQPEFMNCLDENSYQASQRLSEQLLGIGSAGIIYPGVRRAGGTCMACFRPALVYNVRKSARYRFTWSGKVKPKITLEERFLQA